MNRSAIALFVSIIALLACSGMTGDTGSDDGPVNDVTDGEEEEEEEDVSPDDRIQGSWMLAPGDRALRSFKIMLAGASGKKKQLEKLGKLDDGEKRLLESIKDKDKKEKESLVNLIKMMKSVRYVFDDDQITMAIDGREISSEDFNIKDSSDSSMHITFDGAMSETHWYIKWTGDDSANVDVQYEGSDLKLAHQLKRKD